MSQIFVTKRYCSSLVNQVNATFLYDAWGRRDLATVVESAYAFRLSAHRLADIDFLHYQDSKSNLVEESIILSFEALLLVRVSLLSISAGRLDPR